MPSVIVLVTEDTERLWSCPQGTYDLVGERNIGHKIMQMKRPYKHAA